MTGRTWAYAAALVLLSSGLRTSVAAQTVHGARPLKGDAEAGTDLYRRYCIMCHSVDAGVKIVGPSLFGEMKGPHAKTAAQVRQQTEVGKGLMPSFQGKLDSQQITDLIAYIRKL